MTAAERLPVAIDAMGGDRAPAEIVAGAIRARDELDVPVVLVGRPDEIGDADGIEVIAASEVGISKYEGVGKGSLIKARSSPTQTFKTFTRIRNAASTASSSPCINANSSRSRTRDKTLIADLGLADAT